MATIEKHGKSYRYKIGYQDKQGNNKRYVKGGFSTKTEARHASEEMEIQMRHGSSLDKQDVTINDYYKKWVEVYKKPNVGYSSMNRFNNIATVIDNYFPNTKITDISKMDYQSFMNDYQKTRSTVTCKKTNSIIRSCIQDAIDDQIIYSDFTRKVTINGAPSKKRAVKFLSIDNFKKLIDYADKNKSYSAITYYMILTGAYTGLRFEEIGGLTWNNVDFEKKEIYVKNIYDYQDTKKIVPRTKTPSSVRTIPLLPELSIILKQLKKEQAEWQLKNKYRDPENAVFKSSECKIPTDTGCIKTLMLIQDEINIPRKQQIATHGLRHTLASYLLAKGVQIKYVSELLGHKNTAITMRAYEHLLKEQNIEQQGKTLNALNKLSK